jgi:hypothetical protein
VHHDRIDGTDSQGKQQSYTVDKWMMCHLINKSIQKDDIKKEEYFKTNIRRQHTASLTCG